MIGYYLTENLDYYFDICFSNNGMDFVNIFKSDIFFKDFQITNNIKNKNVKEEIDNKFNFITENIDLLLEKFN